MREGNPVTGKVVKDAAGLKDRAAADALVAEADRLAAEAERAEREVLEIVASKI